jgi:nucleoside-diphosphate-sugar epimerase
MDALVTGAPGWLGTELVRRLDERDESIRCLTLPGIDTSELDEFDVSAVDGDVRYPESLRPAFDGNVDVVFHCAGIIHPPTLTGANMFFEVNADGTRNMLAEAARNDVDHFVYVSSNAAQGFNDDRDEWMTEDMPCEPESNYGRSKYQAEQYVRHYADEHGLDYTIVRPCWYYGPRQPDRMTELMNMIQDGRPILFGNGNNLRSMTYVPALADALLTVADDPDTSKGETYWIADEEPYSTNHIYRTIAEQLGVEEEMAPRYIPGIVSWGMERLDVTLGELGFYEQHVHVAGEMRRNIACDPSKAMAELNYDPPSDLSEGMRRSVEWARENGKV